MIPKRVRTRAVDIKVNAYQTNLWKCAAALEPVPPTWAGPTWDELLATPVDPQTHWMTVKLLTSFTALYRTREERETMFLTVPMMITDQALLILEKHGLAPIPVKYTPSREPDDSIPF